MASLPKISVKARHTLYNITGISAQVAAVLVAVPVYVHYMGWSQYGVFVLLMTLLNYPRSVCSGIENAVKKYCAMSISEETDINDLFWSSTLVAVLFSVALGAVLYGVSYWLVLHVFTLTPVDKQQALASIPLLVIGVFLFSILNVINGFLQGTNHFAQFNTVRVAGFYLFQFTPVIAVVMGVRNIHTVIMVAIGSVSVWLGLALVAFLRNHAGITSPHIHRGKLRSILQFGTWTSITGAIIPLMFDIDKIMVSSLLGSSYVAVQSIVIRVYSKLFVIPESLSSVLYNQFATSGLSDTHNQLVRKGVRILLAIQTPVMVFSIIASEPLLTVWIGAAHSIRIYPLILIMLLGVWVYGPAYIPKEWLVASGRPDIFAKLYAVELLPFMAVMYAAIDYSGLVGAECVLVLQMILDSLVAFLRTGTLLYFIRYWLWTVPAIVIAYGSTFLSGYGTVDVLKAVSLMLAMVTAAILYLPYWQNRDRLTTE